MDFQQSKTYINLQSAYGWELNVSTRYEIYGDQAREEQFIEIANNFDIVSKNEKEHARIWLKQLNNGAVPNTETNLNDCAKLEDYSGNTMYRDYARVALEEGYNDIAALFSGVANIELNHNLRFRTEYDNVVNGQVFCKSEPILWICMQCGNILNGNCAPEICPVCGFPQGYYRAFLESDIR